MLLSVTPRCFIVSDRRVAFYMSNFGFYHKTWHHGNYQDEIYTGSTHSPYSKPQSHFKSNSNTILSGKKKKIAHCYFFHCFVYLRSHSTDALKPGFIWTSPHHLTHTSSPFSHTLIPLSSIGPAAPPPSVIIINTQPSRRQMLLAPNNTYIIAPNQHGTHHAC